MSSIGTGLSKAETTFYADDGGVRVTNARLIIGTTTYAMLNVTSVMRAEERPGRGGPVLMFLIAVSSSAVGVSVSAPMGYVVGVMATACGILWWKLQKIKHHLRITSASGEANAVTDFNQQRIDSIVQAVNEAIIGRG